ncbi:MAG: Xaa-Pro peptidase family protein [Ilumatobacteraceae bacterium]
MRIEPTPVDRAADCAARLREHVASAAFDAFLAVSSANVFYATGYRSTAAELFPAHRMVATIAVDRSGLVLPVADSGPAIDAGVEPDSLTAYGRFYFESEGDAARPTQLVDQHTNWITALTSSLEALQLTTATLGVDDAALGDHGVAILEATFPNATFVRASAWAYSVRANKTDDELTLLARAARLAENGISAALAVADEGWTEREIAAVVASTMVAGGGAPRFIVVTAGLRSALADTYATDNTWNRGDLLRFDVGCVVDGYWSDMARTAVLGQPTELQQRRYDQLASGEEEQLKLIRAGVRASEMFALAIQKVADSGFGPYRRQHCGHGIGLEVYEPPVLNPATDLLLEPGMVFCLETPYYELGWGGMMCEDTVVVTEDGHRRFTQSSRELQVIER